MTRQEIEQLNAVEPDYLETFREERWYLFGLQEGLEVADNHPKSPWISVEDDLPCNHEELISLDDKRDTLYVIAVIHGHIVLSRMRKLEGKWFWENDEPTHWFPIPELPKEGE